MLRFAVQTILAAVDRGISRADGAAAVAAEGQKTPGLHWRRSRSASAAIAVAARWGVLACSIGLLAEARILAAPIDRYFKVQIVRICNTAGTVCAATPDFPAETTKIYAQAGILPIFLPILNYNNSAVLNGSNGIPAISQAIFGCPGGCAIPSTTLYAFFANTLNNTIYGNAWLDDNGSAFDASLIANYNGGIGRRDTFAHELGHNLGLDHFEVAQNLMASGGVRAIPSSVADINPSGAQLDQLTASQISTLRNSQFVFADNVPAPLPVVGAAAAFGWSRRLRRRLRAQS